MTDNQTNVQTNVQQVDVDIDSLFDGAPGADSIVTPTDAPTEIKPNIFTKKTTSLDFLDKEEESDDSTFNSKSNDSKSISSEVKADLKDILDDDVKPEDEEEVKPTKAGRPKTEKSGLVEFLKNV